MRGGKYRAAGRRRTTGGVRSHVIGSGGHSLITVKRVPKASLHVTGQMMVLLGRDSIAKQRPVAGVADSGRRSQRPRLQLCGQDCREGYLAVDGLLENFLNGRSDF